MENNSDCMPNDILTYIKYYNQEKRYVGIISLLVMPLVL